MIAEPDAGFAHTIILVRRIMHPQRLLRSTSGQLQPQKADITAGTQIHGFPDLSMGWRYQIPHLLKLGFRVIAPDCIGYGRSVSELVLEACDPKLACLSTN